MTGHRVVRAAATLLALAFASPVQAEPKLEVAAAASLVDVLPRVADAWKQAGGCEVTFTFDASSRLATEIDAGFPADVFFSADTDWMDFLQAHGRLAPETRRDLLGNVLAVVVAAKSGQTPASLQDLTRPEYQRLALAAENVPAGRYARAALKSAGVWDALKDRIVNGSNVRRALDLAARGEVAAAIVYRTDAAAAPVRTAFVLPPKLSPPIIYPAAVPRSAPSPVEAARFLAFCETAPARRIFLDAGFTFAGAP